MDGEDARDFDDAIWAEEDKNPQLKRLEDDRSYSRCRSLCQQWRSIGHRRKEKGNSVYFADRVVPMLPENLSNGLCSLKPNEDRGCLAVEIIIDQFGHKKVIDLFEE